MTGGAKRVGREIALELARQGAGIALHYNASKTDAEKTAVEIKALGSDCKLFQADLSKVSEIQKLAQALADSKTQIDFLINSASIFYKTKFENVTEKDFDDFMNANLKGPFFLSQLIGTQMARRSGGKIINIADWSGFRPYKDYAPYCASKGALITFTKSLARDLAPKVFSNAVAPGPVLLPENFSDEEKKAIEKTTALGRIGSPEDIAKACVFLLQNDFVNGTVLVVDGGRSIV